MVAPHGATPVEFRFGSAHVGSINLRDAQVGVLSFTNHEPVIIDIEPAFLAVNGTNVTVAAFRVQTNHISSLADQLELINLDPAGAFMVAFQVAIYGGLALASPFIIYNLAGFIVPALRRIERHYVGRVFAIATVLFLSGILFCYFVMLPVAFRASVAFSQWMDLGANQWRAEDFISFECKFLLGMGLGFQMPLVLLTLVKIGVLSYEQLAGFRRYMIVICLILGAVLTTPEVITQLMMAGPLYLLFEVSVLIAWYWQWRDKKRGDVVEE
jgi:sec-independent protein translocase protein TatC